MNDDDDEEEGTEYKTSGEIVDDTRETSVPSRGRDATSPSSYTDFRPRPSRSKSDGRTDGRTGTRERFVHIYRAKREETGTREKNKGSERKIMTEEIERRISRRTETFYCLGRNLLAPP